ncbi:MAG: hypothetical protein ACYC1Z_03825, partial [Georgenia sp.]
MSTTPRDGDRSGTPVSPPPPGMTSSPAGSGTVRRPLAERLGEQGNGGRSAATGASPAAAPRKAGEAPGSAAGTSA